MEVNYVKLVIESSSNMSEVLKKLHLKISNGNYRTVKKIIDENLIDISHFNRKLGYGKNNKKMLLNDILTENSNYNSTKLKHRLIEEGVKEHKCEKCGNHKWLDDLIPIELHHVNGNCRDNRLNNLQILCPNCHTLTDNYGSKNIKIKREQPLKKILKPKEYNNELELMSWFEDCDSFLCVSLKRNIPIRTLRSWVDKEKIKSEVLIFFEKNKKNDNELVELVESLKKTKSFLGASKLLNLTDNGVKKRCKKYGLPTNKKDLIEYIRKGE